MTEILEKWILNLSIDPKVLALMIQTTIGLSVAMLVGQIIAFKKYIQLNEPGYQLLSFFFTKIWGFFLSLFKSFGFILIGYVAILAGSYFLGQDLKTHYYNYLVGAYLFVLVMSFFLGFSKERTRSLGENMITRRQ